MSPASEVVIICWLSTWPGKMQPFKDHPNTSRRLKGLRNKPGQRQTDELLAVAHTWIVILCIDC